MTKNFGLEGLAGVKRRLGSKSEQQQLAALEEALIYGQEGLDLFTQQALTDKSEKIQQSAYWVLHQENPYLIKSSQGLTFSEPIFPTDTIACVAISSDNQTIVGGSWQKISVWSLQNGNLLRTLDGHLHWVLSIAISPDGNTLVSGSADKTIKIWNLKTGKLLRKLNAHSSWVNAVAISSDGKTLVSGSADKTVKVWDLSTLNLQLTLNKHSGSVCSVAISPDGKFILSGSTDKTIKLWNLKTGELFCSLEEHSDWVQAVTISLDSKTWISGSRDGEIRIWQADINYKNELNNFQPDNSSLIAKIIGLIILLIIGKLTAGSVFWAGTPFVLFLDTLIGKRNKNISKLNISNWKCIKTIKQELKSVNCLAISHDGKTVVSGGDDSSSKQWNIWTQQLVRTFTGHLSFVSSVAISPDSKILATASYDWVMLWNLSTGESLHALKGCSRSRLSQIEISPCYVQLGFGQTQIFSIKGIDQNSQQMSIEQVSWQTTGGSVDKNGLFLAGQREGKFTVTARVGIFKSSASVTIVEPPKLTRLVINPLQVQMECGENKTFSVRGLDQRGNEIAIDQVSWQATGGNIDANGTFYAGENAGNFKVIATVGIVSNFISIALIKPPKLKTLIISHQSRLEFGQTLRFIVWGVDQYGNNIKIGKVIWSATSGEIASDGTFQASYQEENITITATVGEISCATEVTVIEPARLTKLVISPEQVVMMPGQCQRFEVIGLDQRDRAIAIREVNWEAIGGGINQDGYFFTKDNQKGQFTITATVGRLSISAYVSVLPVLNRLEIYPKQVRLKPGERQIFEVFGFDQQGDEIAVDKIDWKSTRGASINRQGVFQGGYSNCEVTITATVGNISNSSKVTLLPVLRRLEISPFAVQLKPDESHTFTVVGFDQYGNEIDTGEYEWEATGGEIDQNGRFTADHDAKGQFLVTATSKSISKLSEQSQMVLLSIGISTRLLSYVLRFATRMPDSFFTEENTEQTTFVLDSQLQHWIEKTSLKLASRLLAFVSQLCLNKATANLSAFADVKVLPVLRHLEISPEQVQIEPGQSVNFKAKGLDQHNEEISISDVFWEATGGKINSNGTLVVGDKHSNIKITAFVEGNSSFANVTVVTQPKLTSWVVHLPQDKDDDIDGKEKGDVSYRESKDKEVNSNNGRNNQVRDRIVSDKPISTQFKISHSRSITIDDIDEAQQILRLSEELLQAFPNRYRLVILVARRARHILNKTLDKDITLKIAVIKAIQEIYLELLNNDI